MRGYMYIGFGEKPDVLNTKETLRLIRKQHLSMSRFGDGELNIIYGGITGFQTHDSQLADDLLRILHSDRDDLLVCVPDVLKSVRHLRKRPALFWRVWIGEHTHFLKKNLLRKRYGNSLCTRYQTGYRHGAAEAIRLFRTLWEKRDVVFVEGEKTRLGIGNDLFDNAASIGRILCPAANAYSVKEQILAACMQQPKDKLMILALGPTATVLAYDLACAGYQALDLGHVDIQYELFLRGIERMQKIDGKYVNETSDGAAVEDRNLPKTYLQQIIDQIF
ncbi:glycosyl transferase [Clostridia bacterium]|nr:glycosyl transferase [Clostridia bacterium]